MTVQLPYARTYSGEAVGRSYSARRLRLYSEKLVTMATPDRVLSPDYNSSNAAPRSGPPSIMVRHYF
jgi:hypothetical protein